MRTFVPVQQWLVAVIRDDAGIRSPIAHPAYYGNRDRKTVTASLRYRCLISRIYLKRIFGWGTWIRTRTNGVRVRGSTVNLFPKAAVGAKPVGLVGGLINKSAADANTFCKKIAHEAKIVSRRWRERDGLALNLPCLRGGIGRTGRSSELLCTSRFSKKVWRMGAALVQSPQRKIEKAP